MDALQGVNEVLRQIKEQVKLHLPENWTTDWELRDKAQGVVDALWKKETTLKEVNAIIEKAHPLTFDRVLSQLRALVQKKMRLNHLVNEFIKNLKALSVEEAEKILVFKTGCEDVPGLRCTISLLQSETPGGGTIFDELNQESVKKARAPVEPVRDETEDRLTSCLGDLLKPDGPFRTQLVEFWEAPQAQLTEELTHLPPVDNPWDFVAQVRDSAYRHIADVAAATGQFKFDPLKKVPPTPVDELDEPDKPDKSGAPPRAAAAAAPAPASASLPDAIALTATSRVDAAPAPDVVRVPPRKAPPSPPGKLATVGAAAPPAPPLPDVAEPALAKITSTSVADAAPVVTKALPHFGRQSPSSPGFVASTPIKP